MPSLSLRINLDPDGRIGPGKIELLEGIAAFGSISEGARQMNMSYKHAWTLVEDMTHIVAVLQSGCPPSWRTDPAAALDPAMPAEAKAATAAAVLRAMSLTRGHARLVLLLGHGATVANNPHASACHCGACGGHTGEVSARLLARLLNDPEARAGLPAQGIDLPAQGIDLPADIRFVAGLHDTTDAVTLCADAAAGAPAADLARAQAWLAEAGALRPESDWRVRIDAGTLRDMGRLLVGAGGNRRGSIRASARMHPSQIFQQVQDFTEPEGRDTVCYRITSTCAVPPATPPVTSPAPAPPPAGSRAAPHRPGGPAGSRTFGAGGGRCGAWRRGRCRGATSRRRISRGSS